MKSVDYDLFGNVPSSSDFYGVFLDLMWVFLFGRLKSSQVNYDQSLCEIRSNIGNQASSLEL